MTKKPTKPKAAPTPVKKEIPTSPKGMRDLIGKESLAYQGFFEKCAEISTYYGFTPIELPIMEQEDLFRRSSGETSDIVEKEMYALKTKGGDRLALRPEPTAGIMRAYLEHGMQSWPQPVMLYTYGTFYRHDKPQRGRYRELRQFDLEILGTEKSIADATIIHTCLAMFREAGLENVEVHINSIGDKECRGSFRRELINYYKKHLGDICSDCDRRFKDNPLRLLDCKEEKCQPIKAGAPDPVSYLCEECKKHFKEVLEYLETLGIQYTINPRLVRGLDYYTRTVFEFFYIPNAPAAPASEDAAAPTAGEPTEGTKETSMEGLAIGAGGRYDYLAKEIGSNKPVPAVGAGIGADRVVAIMKNDLTPRIMKKPKIFFIQLGFEAKLKSLSVVEVLREAKVPVYHSLSKDSLGSQLATAEKLKIPHAIILGQKEVIENSVIVRDMETRSQKTVPIDKLAAYLKNM